jgi:hypothetical protein
MSGFDPKRTCQSGCSITDSSFAAWEPSTDQAMTTEVHFLLEMIYRRRSADDIRGARIA